MKNLTIIANNLNLSKRGEVKIDKNVKITHNANINILDSFLTDSADNLKNSENFSACSNLKDAFELRNKWVYKKPIEYYGGLNKELYKEFDYKISDKPKKIPYEPYNPVIPEIEDGISYENCGGVFVICITKDDKKELYSNVLSFKEYLTDLNHLLAIINMPSVRSFSYDRLQTLDQCFDMHITLSGSLEKKVQKIVPHRDFNNVKKVDNHIHLSAAMTAV